MQTELLVLASRRVPTRTAVWALALFCLVTWRGKAQTTVSVERSLEEAQAAMLQHHYGEATRVLEAALKRYPGDNRLRVELGRACVYTGNDRRAIRLFREVLRQEPASRPAKLGLAQALGYRREYDESNRLYNELLAARPDDEAAAIGLVNNLMRQRQTAEASRLVEQALALHPNSLRLQEFKDRLAQGELGPEERPPRRAPYVVLGYGDYVADSEGNRFWQLSQRFDSEIGHLMANRLAVEERRLWKTGESEPPMTVTTATDDMRLRLTNWLWLTGGGGLVHFPTGNSYGLYTGGLALEPARRLLLEGSFSRVPLYPTAQAADLDLLVEGWQAQATWQPGHWNMGARWTQAHISDGNHVVRENAELLRWFGSPRFSFGTGYRYTHYEFSEHVHNGYFNPRHYQSHLGLAGFNFRVGRVFHAEYMLRVGAEKISATGYQPAWEVNLHNSFPLGSCELSADYFYFRLAEVTGAYRAQGARMGIAYRF